MSVCFVSTRCVQTNQALRLRLRDSAFFHFVLGAQQTLVAEGGRGGA